MQVVSYFLALYKKCYTFSKWKVVKAPTCSLNSPYTKHGNPHFYTLHRLNRLPMSTLTLDSHWLY